MHVDWIETYCSHMAVMAVLTHLIDEDVMSYCGTNAYYRKTFIESESRRTLQDCVDTQEMQLLAYYEEPHAVT